MIGITRWRSVSRMSLPVLFRKYRWGIISIAGAWCVFAISVFVLVLLPYYDTDGRAAGHRSRYVRLNQDNTGAIVFVHGVLGDSVSTWTNAETKAYWPDLLTNDPMFDRYNIFVYQFSSPLIGKSYTIEQVAGDMKRVLLKAIIPLT